MGTVSNKDMCDYIIKVEGLGKSYRLRHMQEGRRYVALRDVITESCKRLLRPSSFVSRPASEQFWALKDVSFEVKPGEVIGVIGRNGAGKSTLLKILSRITQPSRGRIRVRGRVASLLEVGTGFHPELTGRENIFLNGAILGMSRIEIRQKFDEIVAFSDVEKFLDTPVKHYSSGMYVRLAFAVAAHLEPEILVVDEVLAVGDVEFQRKCLGKMGAVAQSGRTVLFVSHNMASVQRLCSKCFLLDQGKVIDAGLPSDIIMTYLNGSGRSADVDLTHVSHRSGSGLIQFSSFHLESIDGRRIDCVQSGMDFFVVLGFHCKDSHRPARNIDVGFSLHSADTTMLSVLYCSYTGRLFEKVPSVGEFRCLIHSLPLKAGRYLVGVRLVANREEADWPRDLVAALDVVAGDFHRSGHSGFEGSAPLLLDGTWDVRSNEPVTTHD